MKKKRILTGLPVLLGARWLGLGPAMPSREFCRALLRIVVVFLAVHGAASGVVAAEAENQSTAAVNPVTKMARAERAAGLDFETSAHRAWYGVFWTGKCSELPFFERLVCLKGNPTWAEVTKMVLAKARPGARAVLRAKMMRLGRMIGYEWARHNDDRRINSDDLKRWSDWLKDGPDVANAIDRLSEAARRRLTQQ